MLTISIIVGTWVVPCVLFALRVDPRRLFVRSATQAVPMLFVRGQAACIDRLCPVVPVMHVQDLDGPSEAAGVSMVTARTTSQLFSNFHLLSCLMVPL